jgi:hypothetical protein
MKGCPTCLLLDVVPAVCIYWVVERAVFDDVQTARLLVDVGALDLHDQVRQALAQPDQVAR